MSQGIECSQEPVWYICRNLNCVVNWLDHWQTMLTGIGAIIAASVSIYYLKKQISESTTQETARRARRFVAARARMPLLLSDTIQYSNDAMDLLKRYLDVANNGTNARETLANLARPVLPESAILAFETIIENSDDDGFANVIADMISQMQVLNSRILGLNSDNVLFFRKIFIHI